MCPGTLPQTSKPMEHCSNTPWQHLRKDGFYWSRNVRIHYHSDMEGEFCCKVQQCCHSKMKRQKDYFHWLCSWQRKTLTSSSIMDYSNTSGSHTLFVRLPWGHTVSVRNLRAVIKLKTLSAHLELLASIPAFAFEVYHGDRLLDVKSRLSFDDIHNGAILRLMLRKEYKTLDVQSISEFVDLCKDPSASTAVDRQKRVFVALATCCYLTDVATMKECLGKAEGDCCVLAVSWISIARRQPCSICMQWIAAELAVWQPLVHLLCSGSIINAQFPEVDNNGSMMSSSGSQGVTPGNSKTTNSRLRLMRELYNLSSIMYEMMYDGTGGYGRNQNEINAISLFLARKSSETQSHLYNNHFSTDTSCCVICLWLAKKAVIDLANLFSWSIHFSQSKYEPIQKSDFYGYWI